MPYNRYLQIFFNARGEPCSGKTLQFLLEKTRVAYQGPNERNFHVFYQLLAGSSDEDKKNYGFEGPASQFLFCGSCTTVDNVDDALDFQYTRRAMETLQIPKDVQIDIFSCLAAILHLGNMQFVGADTAALADAAPVEWAAYLLGMQVLSPNSLTMSVYAYIPHSVARCVYMCVCVYVCVYACVLA